MEVIQAKADQKEMGPGRREERKKKGFAGNRRTLKHEMEMRVKVYTKRVETEMLGTAKVERENQNLTLERIRLKAEEHRNTDVAANYVSERLDKLSLVRDTNRTSLFEVAKHSIKTT